VGSQRSVSPRVMHRACMLSCVVSVPGRCSAC
jgi:hypothetical protein